MSAILYARVSTNEQADKELSIPTQVRVLKRVCAERGWPVEDVFTDVGSGTSLKQRPGLVAAVNKACKNEDVEYLVVHRLDRFARSMIIHLTLKEKLQRNGVRLVSAVENCEDTPVGQFIERIMAAQAEFYSASLSERVRDGLKERLLSGRWTGVPPLGYLSSNGSVIVDPARGRFIVKAFKLWSTGAYTSKVLAEELYQSGFLSKHGKRVAYSKLCRILHNPFYIGRMRVCGEVYDGIHPPLISEELFERCEEVFRTKFPNRGKQRKHCFLLSRKLICRGCLSYLVGEQHKKKSGRCYRYYRCHQKSCRLILRAEPLDEDVKKQLAEKLDDKQTAVLLGNDPHAAKAVLDQAIMKVDLDENHAPKITFRYTPMLAANHSKAATHRL